MTSALATAACFRALRRGDELEKFLRIGEPRFQFFRTGAQGLRGELRGGAHFRERGILGDEADFVHANFPRTLRARP